MVNGLPYVPNRRLFHAVKYSLAMQRDGVDPDVANSKAAEYYGCIAPQVASYVRVVPAWLKNKADWPE